MRVRVLSVTRAIDVETGGPIWQVAFGRVIPLTGEMRDRMQAGGQAPPQVADIGLNTMVLVTRFEGPVPYLLDSEWNLDIADDGAITLRRVQDGG